MMKLLVILFIINLFVQVNVFKNLQMKDIHPHKLVKPLINQTKPSGNILEMIKRLRFSTHQ